MRAARASATTTQVDVTSFIDWLLENRVSEWKLVMPSRTRREENRGTCSARPPVQHERSQAGEQTHLMVGSLRVDSLKKRAGRWRCFGRVAPRGARQAWKVL